MASEEPVIQWLLERENPSVRRFTLEMLLERAPDAPEVIAARRDIGAYGPVPRILALQDADGWWGRPEVTYKPLMYRSTAWQIMFLAELGADPADDRIRRGCEYVLTTMQTERGDFPPHGQQYHKFSAADMLCYDAMTTWALLRLGYAGDNRLQRAIEFIARMIEEANFKCHFNGNQPCAWGAVKTLRAFAEVPDVWRTPDVLSAIEHGVNFILDGNLAQANYPTKPHGSVSKQWSRFGFPRGYQSDILEALFTLIQLGYGHDVRLKPALDIVISKRQADGTWKLDETPKQMWVELEQRGRPSKWITWRSLYVLKHA